MLAAGLYFREQSSPLYTVDTAGKAVEVGYSAAGRAVTVKSGSATGGAAIVDQPQQGSKVSFQLQEKQQRSIIIAGVSALLLSGSS